MIYYILVPSDKTSFFPEITNWVNYKLTIANQEYSKSYAETDSNVALTAMEVGGFCLSDLESMQKYLSENKAVLDTRIEVAQIVIEGGKAIKRGMVLADKEYLFVSNQTKAQQLLQLGGYQTEGF